MPEPRATHVTYPSVVSNAYVQGRYGDEPIVDAHSAYARVRQQPEHEEDHRQRIEPSAYASQRAVECRRPEAEKHHQSSEGDRVRASGPHWIGVRGSTLAIGDDQDHQAGEDSSESRNGVCRLPGDLTVGRLAVAVARDNAAIQSAAPAREGPYDIRPDDGDWTRQPPTLRPASASSGPASRLHHELCDAPT